jgi:hypothetical protein
VNYEQAVSTTPASAAPAARQEMGPGECATWQHAVDEAALAVSQMRDGGAHVAAVVSGPTSVADTTPRRIPSSPGQTASLGAVGAGPGGQGH